MTGGLIALALLILCFTHSTVISGKITDPGTDESTLELLHVVSPSADKKNPTSSDLQKSTTSTT